MKILVAVKRVVDAATHIRIKADGSAVETENVKMAMNPFDEIAVEEAIRLRESGLVKEVVVVSIGVSATQEILRTALAMGADRAIWVETDLTLQPLAIAKILRALAEQESPKLIILGKQAIDSDDNQVGQMLAALLKWPQGTFISGVELADDSAKVTREIDGGLETLLLKLPAVLTTDLRLNQPRYLSLPNIVQAKRKPMNHIDVNTLGINLNSQLQVKSVTAPEKQRAGIMLSSVAELIDKLRNEEQVIP